MAFPTCYLTIEPKKYTRKTYPSKFESQIVQYYPLLTNNILFTTRVVKNILIILGIFHLTFCIKNNLKIKSKKLNLNV